MAKGIFITVEGTDGSGKTTQLAFLREYLEELGREVLVTREPGGTPIGEKLREILLDSANAAMGDRAEVLLYAAARAQHVDELIRPALERGAVVLSDRFTDSSIAYQGYGRELGSVVGKVNAFATDGLKPDITFFLSLPPAEGRKRMEARAFDRIESEQLTFHERVYAGYLAAAAAEPERIRVIDASKSIEEVREEIYSALDAIFKGASPEEAAETSGEPEDGGRDHA